MECSIGLRWKPESNFLGKDNEKIYDKVVKKSSWYSFSFCSWLGVICSPTWSYWSICVRSIKNCLTYGGTIYGFGTIIMHSRIEFEGWIYRKSIDRSSYSPDLALCVFFLFWKLKEAICASDIQSINRINQNWWKAIIKSSFRKCLESGRKPGNKINVVNS